MSVYMNLVLIFQTILHALLRKYVVFLGLNNNTLYCIYKTKLFELKLPDWLFFKSNCYFDAW